MLVGDNPEILYVYLRSHHLYSFTQGSQVKWKISAKIEKADVAVDVVPPIFSVFLQIRIFSTCIILISYFSFLSVSLFFFLFLVLFFIVLGTSSRRIRIVSLSREVTRTSVFVAAENSFARDVW